MKAKTVLCLCIIVAVTAVFAGIAPEKASAVPSFAKQTGRPCSGCHTIWPRLNATGREFKLQGYTEVADDYPRIEQDNLDLLRYGPPLAVSIISFPYQKITGQRDQTRIPEEFALYFAGRVTPNIGVFATPHWLRETGQFTLELVKMSAATRIGESNIVGIVVGKMDVAGADPYNTIRYTAFHTINTPALLSQKRANGDFFKFFDNANEGVVLNGKFFQTVYAAVGGFRGDGSAAQVESDPIDVFGRLVFEYPVFGVSIASLGGFYYGGKEGYNHDATAPDITIPEYYTRIQRYGVDFQWQLESDPHTIDAVAVYMQGQDRGVDQIGIPTPFPDPGAQIKFKGMYAELSYFYQRMYGMTLGYDYMNSEQDNSLNKQGPTINFTYSPWMNTKFGLEFSKFDHANGIKERDTNLLVHLYF
jgi:hypothetical protein